MLIIALGTLVKELKIERNDKICIEKNIFFNFQKVEHTTR